MKTVSPAQAGRRAARKGKIAADVLSSTTVRAQRAIGGMVAVGAVLAAALADAAE